MAGQRLNEFLYERELNSASKSAAQLLQERGKTNPNARDIHFIEIDGNNFSGYIDYSFYIQKTYAKEPSRSTAGVIDNLDSYATFLTPTVKIKFNTLSIENYRAFIKLMHSKNEHTVRCYDVVYDTYRTFNAYFAPDDYPELFVLDFETLAVLNYEVELIGTNTDLNTRTIVYHLNPPMQSGQTDSTVASTNYYVGQEVVIGQEANSLTTLTGYNFDSWNTKADGSGMKFINNTAWTISEDLILYAVWKGGNQFTISYNYGEGEIYKDGNGNDVTSKPIIYNEPITFTSTRASEVEYYGENYYPYNDETNWYFVAQPVDGNQEIINGQTPYTVSGNATIYQIITKKNVRIDYTYYTEIGEHTYTGTWYSTGKYGDNIPETSFSDKEYKWLITHIKQPYGTFKDVESQKQYFTATTFPPTDIKVKMEFTGND